MAREGLFRRIVDEFGDPLWRVAGGYANDRDDREDLYQDILVALWQAAEGFRGDSSLRTFVYRVAHNRGISHRAYEQRRRHEPVDDDPVVSRLPDPLENVEAEATRTRLLHAIRQLSPTLGQPLMLRLEGLDNAEIAQILGLRPGTVAVRLTRARNALRDHLAEASP